MGTRAVQRLAFFSGAKQRGHAQARKTKIKLDLSGRSMSARCDCQRSSRPQQVCMNKKLRPRAYCTVVWPWPFMFCYRIRNSSQYNVTPTVLYLWVATFSQNFMWILLFPWFKKAGGYGMQGWFRRRLSMFTDTYCRVQRPKKCPAAAWFVNLFTSVMNVGVHDIMCTRTFMYTPLS